MTGRSQSGVGFGLGIRGRLTMWFVLGAVGAVVLGSVVVYVSGLTTIQGTLGQTYCQIASRIVRQFDNRFLQETGFVRTLATDVLTTEVALEEVVLCRARPSHWINAHVDRKADEWRRMPTDADRRAHLHPQLSHRLSVLAGLRPGLVEGLSVFDAQGLAIAASHAIPERTAKDANWFKAAVDQERHFTFLDLDPGTAILTVAVPVWGGVDIVGYVVAEFNFAEFANELKNIRFGETGEVIVVDRAGVPLEGGRRPFLQHALARTGTNAAAASEEAGSDFPPYWVAVPDVEGWSFWRRLACVAPVPMINRLRSHFGLSPWAVVVTQSPEESYAALRGSLGSFTIAGFIGVLVVGAGGAFIAWHIAAPLKDLQRGVRRFARGERDRSVQVSTKDEIGELADEFNRMAERVTASENELRAFAEAVKDAADAIIMTDRQGVIYYANPAFETVTGYSYEEVKGRTPSILRSSKTKRKVHADMWRAVGEGQPWRGELWNKRKSGEIYPVDLTISPIHDENGNVVSLLGIHRDITLARAYQESLEKEVQARTREIAETEGLAVMGRLASMIAHDLRNALSTVKMSLQILFRRHGEKGDAAYEHCQMGLEQVGFMEEILRDMLSYARPERLRSDWHDIAELIENAIVALAHPIEVHGVAIVREDESGLPKTYCDRIKIVEVLRNLVDNSVQAMADGGTLTITTDLVLEASVPMVRVTLRDTGPGIPEDVLPDVLEPFFTTRSRGTGLGLAIVKRIIGQHGGQISVRSDFGVGTEVAFTLPTAPATE